MSEFRFEEPPADARTTKRGHDHFKAAAALREQPGRWALIRTTPTSQAARSAAHQIRDGRINAYLPAGSFDATSRTVDGEFRVYARYIGHVGTEAGEV
ncbi:hypothetical protein CFC35_05460 [Streptomyces sp. FBKL.4005]|uniref:hypothetical protein n=1 Tax=Streptomyces sp. FBKL.4005 TaxID=2015515 RepID=UPI000B95EDD8|nr:hypothetical protein [Streptomyces sp. FBKL.4005]OYP14012.1 hypothetical protein CFC35_05460 [Streptomyces sp. FBKL.4005]